MADPTEETPQQKDKKTRINQMKGEANKTSQLADMLAKGIGQGMTADDFKNKWIPNFEKGYVNFTPDTADDQKPYDDEYSRRPRVKILKEGSNTAD